MKDVIIQESSIKPEETAEPEWKRGIALRKTRQTGAPAKGGQTVTLYSLWSYVVYYHWTFHNCTSNQKSCVHLKMIMISKLMWRRCFWSNRFIMDMVIYYNSRSTCRLVFYCNKISKTIYNAEWFYLHSFYVAKKRLLECVDWPIKNKYLLNAVWNVYRNHDMVKYVHVKCSCRMHLSVFMHEVKMAQLKNIGLRYSQTIDVSTTRLSDHFEMTFGWT